MPDLPEDRMAGVYFDLSLAEEGAGDLARACTSLRRVVEIEPGFPGAADRLESLESGGDPEPAIDAPDGGFESFDDDGFFHTGDKADWDEKNEAYRITGRVKDIFKSAKGKYVAPLPIESLLSSNPLLEQICVMGSGLPAPVAVVVLENVLLLLFAR